MRFSCNALRESVAPLASRDNSAANLPPGAASTGAHALGGVMRATGSYGREKAQKTQKMQNCLLCFL
jgi:hypothetical protein